MMTEIFICVGIALAIMLGFGLLIKFGIWLEDNTNIDVETFTLIVVIFIIITLGVWGVRACIREYEETKLQRRRIRDSRTFRR